MGLPAPQGLYDPGNERDACGIGFIANIKGERSHEIIVKGIQILINLTHRGACGCDPETGDGAGLTIQVPHEFFARECGRLGFTLPNPGEYGWGWCSAGGPGGAVRGCAGRWFGKGLSVLGWRVAPIDDAAIGRIGTRGYRAVFIQRAPGWTLARWAQAVRGAEQVEAG
jgi:glutamate synthase domain-containing protein 1